MTDELFLSQNDSRPMYLQIMAQIKQKIRMGDWPAGHPLPSIRELSAQTKVSVITVKRAYSELEIEGVIVTQAGRGSFVALCAELPDLLAHSELTLHINTVVDGALALGLDEEGIIALIKQVIAARQ